MLCMCLFVKFLLVCEPRYAVIAVCQHQLPARAAAYDCHMGVEESCPEAGGGPADTHSHQTVSATVHKVGTALCASTAWPDAGQK